MKSRNAYGMPYIGITSEDGSIVIKTDLLDSYTLGGIKNTVNIMEEHIKQMMKEG